MVNESNFVYEIIELWLGFLGDIIVIGKKRVFLEVESELKCELVIKS